MAKFRINPKKLNDLVKNLNLTEDEFIKSSQNALVQWGEDTVGDLGKETLKLKITDQGQYLGSHTRGSLEIKNTTIRQPLFNPSEHSVVVEFGRRAKKGKKPPLIPLIGWAKRHGMITSLPTNVALNTGLQKKLIAAYSIRKRVRERGGKSSGKKGTGIDPQIKDFMVAIGIKDAIWERGTKGRHVYTNMIERKRKTFVKDIAAVIRL